MAMSEGADKPPDVGDAVYLGQIISTQPIYGVAGPPGPPGPAGEVSVTYTFPGAREVPPLVFAVDEWEYSFPTTELARKVRDELMRMTLEGEL